jgi:hypothetical protein
MIKKFSIIQLAHINSIEYKGVIQNVNTIVINRFKDPLTLEPRLAVFIFLCNSIQKKVSKKFATNLFNIIRSFDFSDLKKRNIRDYYFSKFGEKDLDEGIDEIEILKYFWDDGIFDKFLIRSLYEEYV